MGRRTVSSIAAITMTVVACTVIAAVPAGASTDTSKRAASTTSRFVTKAVAVNYRDHHARIRQAFAQRSTDASIVAADNVAVAYARCTYCRAIAVAFQIVLASDAPTQVSPRNLAEAVNDHCVHCHTSALAYQFVVVTHGDARLTRLGRAELAEVRAELARLLRRARSHPSGSTSWLEGQVAGLAARVGHILSTQIRVSHDSDRARETARRSAPCSLTTRHARIDHDTTAPRATSTARSPGRGDYVRREPIADCA